MPVNASVLKTVSWNTDIGIASLSKDLFSQLKYYQEKATDAGEADSELPEYKQPKDLITTNTKLNQRLCFNFIRHQGTVSDIPSIKLFKSFTSTLKKVDPSISILPFQSNKRHYSSLVTLKQIETMEDNKLHQFFKSYHQRQHYSISSYFHVSTVLSFDEIVQNPNSKNGLTIIDTSCVCAQAMQKKWLKLECYVLAVSSCFVMT
jgi:hypothetical protein